MAQFGNLLASGERSLRAAPDGHLAVGIPHRRAVVRFNVSLVDGRRIEFTFDDNLGRLETGFEVTAFKPEVLGDVAELLGLFTERIRVHIFVEQRRVGLHRLGSSKHRLQYFVFHLDQLAGFFRNVDRMTAIECLGPGQSVVPEMLQIDGPFAQFGDLVFRIGQIITGRHGMHARQRQCGRKVDRLDVGMGVRAAEHHPVQHAGQTNVSAVLRAAGDFIDAIMANGASSNDVVFLAWIGFSCGHV